MCFMRAVTAGLVLCSGLGICGLGWITPVSAQDAVPEELERLKRLEGSWATDRVEFLTPEGEVGRTSSATAHNEIQLDGRVLVHGGRLANPVIETRGWYYWDPDHERLHMGSVTTSGRYDEFVGGWDGGRLVMTIVPTEALGDRRFRMTHSEFTEDSYLETMSMSEDGGRNWRTTSRQRMHRVGAGRVMAAAPVLQRMGAYTGHWRSEDKTNQAGETFRFEYDMKWMDPGETIARIVIEQFHPDGTVTTVFEGYKGREPSGEGVYYHGASPSGRGSRGDVFLEDGDFVTLYDGWTADGGVVKIRDVFAPVEDGSFVSRTYLRASPDAAWRQIGEDHWTRQGPAR